MIHSNQIHGDNWMWMTYTITTCGFVVQLNSWNYGKWFIQKCWWMKRERKKLKNHAQYVHSSFTVSTAVWHPVKSTNFYVIIRFHIYQHIFIRRRSGDLQMSNHLLLLNKKALTKRIFIKKLYRERYCMLCWMLSVHSIHWKISCHNAS